MRSTPSRAHDTSSACRFSSAFSSSPGEFVFGWRCKSVSAMSCHVNTNYRELERRWKSHEAQSVDLSRFTFRRNSAVLKIHSHSLSSGIAMRIGCFEYSRALPFDDRLIKLRRAQSSHCARFVIRSIAHRLSGATPVGRTSKSCKSDAPAPPSERGRAFCA